MMSEPRLICLDDPPLGLAPMVVQDIFSTIKASTQLEPACCWSKKCAPRARDWEPWLRAPNGFNYYQRRLRHDERVREAYLGRSAAERLRI